MKRIIFFSTPAYGHIVSVYPIIKKLVSKGYEVDWYGSKRFESFAHLCGANFIEYPEDFEAKYRLSEITSDFFQLMKSLMKLNRQCYKWYHKSIDWDNVDLILYDSMCSFGKNLGVSKKISHICLCTTMAYNWWVLLFSNMGKASLKLSLSHWREGLALLKEEKDFRKQYHLPKFKLVDFFVNAGEKTLVMTPPEFQPFVKTFHPSFHFVGTTIKDRCLDNITPYENYDVYISLGSIFTENESLLDTLLSQIKKEKVIVSVGGLNLKSKGENIRLESFTNQLSLLPKVRVFINHGGLNSIYEALYFEVFQVCIPQQEEMRMSALRLQRLGLGLCKEEIENLDIDRINKQADIYKDKIKTFSKIIRSYDATVLSVEVIEAALGRK